MNQNITSRKAAAEEHLTEAREAAARTDLEFIEHAVTTAHPEAGQLHLYVNPSDSEYFTAQLTDADGAHITDDAGDIVVFHEDDTDECGEPIRVPVTVSDLMSKAMSTLPSDAMEQLLVPADEDADCNGRFYLPLPLTGAE